MRRAANSPEQRTSKALLQFLRPSLCASGRRCVCDASVSQLSCALYLRSGTVHAVPPCTRAGTGIGEAALERSVTHVTPPVCASFESVSLSRACLSLLRAPLCLGTDSDERWGGWNGHEDRQRFGRTLRSQGQLTRSTFTCSRPCASMLATFFSSRTFHNPPARCIFLPPAIEPDTQTHRNTDKQTHRHTDSWLKESLAKTRQLQRHAACKDTCSRQQPGT